MHLRKVRENCSSAFTALTVYRYFFKQTKLAAFFTDWIHLSQGCRERLVLTDKLSGVLLFHFIRLLKTMTVLG